MQEAPRAANAGEQFCFTSKLAPGTPESPAFRDRSLSRKDDPLLAQHFMSTLPLADSASLEITEIGDIVLRKGDLPACLTEDEPLWAHRAVSPVGGKANGGAMCVFKSWLGRPVKLTVKNGRWTVDRGFWCTMGQSPRPAGSWRCGLSWDSRGRAKREASLDVLEDDNLVVASGDEVLWSSVSPAVAEEAQGMDDGGSQSARSETERVYWMVVGM